MTKPINDYGYYYNLAGFGVEAGCPQIFAQRRMRWRDLNYKPHNTIIKVANVGWVFGETQSDGSFEVELYGLVNRHILTIVLGKATQYAKFLDDERILKLAQSKSNWVNNVRW